jgi:flagellar biosynthetic protein FliR
MPEFTDSQLEAFVAQYFWPFARIAACLTAAPIFSARMVPMRIRIVLAGAITLLAVPLLASPPAVPVFSAEGVLITIQQVLIGLASGFVLQLCFDAVGLGGQLLANSMGLSYAYNIDPMHGASTPSVGQFYMLMTTMTFVALNGHLALLEMLVHGFTTLPVGTGGLGRAGLWTLLTYSSHLFSGAVAVALPGMTALLVVNLAFGVMSRAAPSLNLFAVGFPITLFFGLVVIVLGMPFIQSNFIGLVDGAFETLGKLGGVAPR